MLKSVITPFALNGFAIKRGAVDGLASFMGFSAIPALNFFRAPERCNGFPDSLAPPSSARYSLDLEMAS